MRHYFKEGKVKKTKLYTFAEENGADYIEDDNAIWKIPKGYGTDLIAFQLREKGYFKIGRIDEDCDNFVDFSNPMFFPEEGEWLTTVLPLVTAYNKLLKKKKRRQKK